MNDYVKAIHEEMKTFAEMPNSIFIGQQVGVTNFYNTLSGINMEKRIEMPVAEELQLGMSIGMALEGYLPISIFQRMDFLPRACDQLVNHLDILDKLSHGKFNPKVIIRVTVGSKFPLDTGLQHNKDLSLGFNYLLENTKLINVRNAREVKEAYFNARRDNKSIIIVEFQDLYK